MTKTTFTLSEVSSLTGLSITLIDTWIEREWISPIAAETLDHEDVARLRLIHELQDDFGANEDAIPLILHLMDQLCHIKAQLHRLRNSGT
jgi:chaperone modulatory protein CbpM